MPMVWTAEADAKLMAYVIKMLDIKLNGAQMAELAQIMGPDCTPKAISHRMTNFRKLAGGTASPTKTNTGAAKATKATKPTPKKNGGKKGANARAPSSEEEENDTRPPATSRPKRAGAKRDYTSMADEGSDADAEGEEDDGLTKKVKIEVGEDIGEGLRQAAEEDDE